MTMTPGDDETPEDVVVLTGEHNGLDWKIVATWGLRSDPVEGRELMTMLHGFEGTKRVIGPDSAAQPCIQVSWDTSGVVALTSGRIS